MEEAHSEFKTKSLLILFNTTDLPPLHLFLFFFSYLVLYTSFC